MAAVGAQNDRRGGGVSAPRWLARLLKRQHDRDDAIVAKAETARRESRAVIATLRRAERCPDRVSLARALQDLPPFWLNGDAAQPTEDRRES